MRGIIQTILFMQTDYIIISLMHCKELLINSINCIIKLCYKIIFLVGIRRITVYL